MYVHKQSYKSTYLGMNKLLLDLDIFLCIEIDIYRIWSPSKGTFNR